MNIPLQRTSFIRLLACVAIGTLVSAQTLLPFLPITNGETRTGYATMKEAIAEADEGATLFIYDDLFDDTAVIGEVKRGMTIASAQECVRAPVFYGDDAGGGVCAKICENDVTIRGLTFTGWQGGVAAPIIAVANASNVRFISNTFTNNTASSFALTETHTAYIEGNRFIANRLAQGHAEIDVHGETVYLTIGENVFTAIAHGRESAIRIRGVGRKTSFITITGNTFFGYGRGVAIAGASGTIIEENTFREQDIALSIERSSHTNRVLANRFIAYRTHALLVSESDAPEVVGNVVSNGEAGSAAFSFSSLTKPYIAKNTFVMYPSKRYKGLDIAYSCMGVRRKQNREVLHTISLKGVTYRPFQTNIFNNQPVIVTLQGKKLSPHAGYILQGDATNIHATLVDGDTTRHIITFPAKGAPPGRYTLLLDGGADSTRAFTNVVFFVFDGTRRHLSLDEGSVVTTARIPAGETHPLFRYENKNAFIVTLTVSIFRGNDTHVSEMETRLLPFETYEGVWDGRDMKGAPLPSGFYYARVLLRFDGGRKEHRFAFLLLP